jgi:hypothetical protein
MDIWFLTLLPIMALIYAMVGHGGASAYLALMALFSFSPDVMRPTALLLNLFVAGISFIHFWRAGHFNLKLFLVFAVSSIPFSYLGGLQDIDEKIYKKILGVLLLFAIARILGLFGKQKNERNINWPIGLLIGAIVGYFSGLIGIGGGIILSPIILLLGWGNVKETAAVSALFIWVNSLAGIFGQMTNGINLASNIWIYVVLAVLGGLIGGYVGSQKFNFKQLNIALAVVLLSASVKLVFF